ncbi:glycosyltransferase [Photobacterium carnosum]|uniref:glycosyltransferase n=1 Tax=Photobacterium carnosum TaxID=2023717 RepID=UPI001E5EDD02|nr:glycosyltransferase [Photobacterium carnosum]MCD9546748.1 glycosyltransferase [Photobacterium carnosum]
MKTKKVILFIDTFYPGGAERVCVNYANELNELGLDVSIICYNRNENFYIDELSGNIQIVSLNIKSGMWLFKKINILNKLLIGGSIVIAFNHQISILLYLYNKINSKFKLISRNVNNLSQDLKAKKGNSIKRALTLFLMNRFYCRIGCYIAQCELMKLDMQKDMKVRGSDIEVIHNPVAKKYIKLELKKDIDILFIGRLKKQKGIDNLIKIMELLKVKGENFNITIVGDGELKSILLSSLNNLGITYEYIRNTDNTLELYNRSRCCVLTSYYEGYPNVLVESLACATPIISFDCDSGPREIIRNNENGFLIEKFDCEDFCDKISYIINTNFEIKEENNNYKEILKVEKMLEL